MKRVLLMKPWNEQMTSGRGPATNLKVSINIGTAIITRAWNETTYFVISMNSNNICEWNLYRQCNVQGGPERSRQSNLAVFAVEGGLNSKLPHLK